MGGAEYFWANLSTLLSVVSASRDLLTPNQVWIIHQRNKETVERRLPTEADEAGRLLQGGSAATRRVGDSLRLRWLGNVSPVAIT